MKIKVDYSVLTIFDNFLNCKDYNAINNKKYFMKNLEENISFKKQMNFYKRNMSSKDYFDIIFSTLNDKTIKPKNTTIKIMSKSFENILNNKNILQNKIKNIQEYDFTKLEDKLLETLPEDTELNVNLHIVLDGFNAECVLDDNNILIDAAFWPSNKENEYKIEGIILHELHHLGFLYWLNKNGKRNEIIKEKNGYELAIKLVESIIGEGAATYFFNQNEDLTDILEEAYGKELAKQYKESLKICDINIEKIIKKFESDLEYLLDNEDGYEKMQERIKDYSFSKEFGQPLDKAIGVHVCRTIESQEGRESLIETFKNPSLFLIKYNNSIKKLKGVALKESVIEKWIKLWE